MDAEPIAEFRTEPETPDRMNIPDKIFLAAQRLKEGHRGNRITVRDFLAHFRAERRGAVKVAVRALREPPDRRKLVAIVYADMVGYSGLIELDDAGTLQRLRALRTNLIDPAINEHGGRVVQTGGDSLLIVFGSIDGAVRWAMKVQREIPGLDGDQPSDRIIRFRIGINIGDAIADGTDLHGDAVNVAARIQAECPPGGICVTRSVRDHVHGRLDLAFEELGSLNLKNIRRPIEAFLVQSDIGSPARKPEAVRADLSLPDKPSIAVLPFTNFSSDREQDYFADGMVDEIITALARIRWLFVIARNSSFTYKGRAVDLKQVGRELGVRYVLEGSVRRGGGRVRITAQLIEAEAGTHLWADRFDGLLEDMFEIQDNIASSVAGVIEPTLEAAEIKRSIARPTNNLTAYDLFLRALPDVGTYEWEPTKRALVLLRQAIEWDPHFGKAMACAGYCHTVLDAIGKVEDLEANRRIALGLARRALRTAGDDSMALACIAQVLAYFNEDINDALAILARSIAVNPNSFWGWRWSGFAHLYNGQPEVAIKHFETSLRLSPLGPQWAETTGIGIGHMFCGRLETAASFLQVALQENPAYPLANRFLASCYAHLGRIDDARQVVARLRAITHVIVPKVTNYRDPTQREMFLSGLRLAASEPNVRRAST
jgi:adenylate cyclase